ncbi:TetR/AcrR family transcriptional regulator [Pseudobacter ginsenosidimutans]|uniref:TetR family transcriptional regulator n=1 Tax=Pseudobacter ginsenosidimutans TaxID=661488 RepID=A0A4Q7N5F4_9BACT|nr:TetR/AcrR family transcriptional regulator [Pseudobacter ginsenosidimutans]QEC44804.1 TetR/AcrR family transcriptional regulator [Pseudobacter ginsenosidimutans]RZS76293.1 TetR family transcriptional regulator [Pseudobacter ginsenosidimutans]
MAGRPKTFDSEEILDKAVPVFWAKGYEAASTEELLEAMGIGKGSFYLAFKGGKKELFEKALIRYRKQQMTTFEQEMLAHSDPLEGIRSLFRSIATTSKSIHLNGCLFGNSIAELSNSDPLLMKKASNWLLQLEKIFYKAILTAQKKGSLSKKQDPELLARQLITIWNGLGITRRLYPDNKILSELIESQLNILK